MFYQNKTQTQTQKIILTSIASVLILLLNACGENNPNNQSNQPNMGMGGKGSISEERTTAFKSFMPTFSQMRKMSNGDEAFDPEKFKQLAQSFTQEARVPFEHFQSDPDGNGDALPNIWQKPNEFKAEQDKFLAAVDKLNTAAQAGKLNEIKAAYDEAGASCQSCHDTYRRPK